MIYFAQDSGDFSIKIGYTSKPEPDARLPGLQTGNPRRLVVLATMPGEMADEEALHERFASARLHGEWFRPVPELLQFILAELTSRAFVNGHESHQEYLAVAAEASAGLRKALPWPLNIYLAGKIGPEHRWREKICGRNTDGESPIHLGSECTPCGGFQDMDWTPVQGVVLGVHNYTGPFYTTGCTHGNPCGGVDDEDSHGVYAQEELGAHDGQIGTRAPVVVRLCRAAIKASDALFAWIDSPDCYGTIVEIGYALALGKKVWVSGPKMYRDMWFIYEAADIRRFDFSDPRDALRQCIEVVRVANRVGAKA